MSKKLTSTRTAVFVGLVVRGGSQRWECGELIQRMPLSPIKVVLESNVEGWSLALKRTGLLVPKKILRGAVADLRSQSFESDADEFRGNDGESVVRTPLVPFAPTRVDPKKQAEKQSTQTPVATQTAVSWAPESTVETDSVKRAGPQDASRGEARVYWCRGC